VRRFKEAVEDKGTIPIYSIRGRPTRRVKIPTVFNTPIRPDVIKRAVLAVQSTRFQPKSRDPMAGKKTTAESMGVGRGLARIPRVKGRGTRRSGQGAFAPGTVGGRLSHPPSAEKVIVKKINKKERKLALRSAVAAAAQKEVVQKRGHRVEEIQRIPIVVEDKIEVVKNTKDLKAVLMALGLESELSRVQDGRRIRAGKGKLRGRRIKQARGPLLVTSKDGGLHRAASNIPGVDVARFENLNAELLAPGTVPGRLTVWSESAFKKLEGL